MLTASEIRENLTSQLYELEVLQSVYPKELKFSDHGVVADINDFINNITKKDLPPKLEYCVEIPDITGKFEMHVILPTEYPQLNPDVYVRSSNLDRIEQTNLNKSLMSYIDEQEKGDPVIYLLISWLQDNAEKYIQNKKNCNKNANKCIEKKQTEFARFWVYSHHIYSKVKRREISDLARECSLSGFYLAGKPGIVCIEGDLEDCNYWWQQVKVMNWHRILVKYREQAEIIDATIDENRKFINFQEISFPTSDRHNDMGQVLKFLTKHNSQHVFKELFGVQGKLNSDDK